MKKLFSLLATERPRGALEARIIALIRKAARRRAKERTALSLAAFGASLAAFIPAARYTLSAFAQSGFYDYVSLAFSDTGTVLSSFQTFLLSLLDSVPLAGVTAALAASTALFYSASFLWRHRAETRLVLSA